MKQFKEWLGKPSKDDFDYDQIMPDYETIYNAITKQGNEIEDIAGGVWFDTTENAMLLALYFGDIKLAKAYANEFLGKQFQQQDTQNNLNTYASKYFSKED